MKVTARFRVEIRGWVTVERAVAVFDAAKADDLHSAESDILDAMADEALLFASERLDGDVYETEVISVEP